MSSLAWPQGLNGVLKDHIIKFGLLQVIYAIQLEIEYKYKGTLNLYFIFHNNLGQTNF